MAQTKVVLNHIGFQELLKSKELGDGLGEIAADIAARAGEGYAYDIYQADTRVIASAYTETTQAMRKEASTNSLLKALQS